MASTYGWTARYVDDELTDEQLTLYLDEAVDRLEADRESEWLARVESARLGVVFAHNRKAYRKWSTKMRRKTSSGVANAMNLERQIAALAITNPEYVVHGPRAEAGVS